MAAGGTAREPDRRVVPPVEGPYSITSSARARSVGGIARSRAFAVLRLMTSSNLVGCSTGSLAGFAPFRTRPAVGAGLPVGFPIARPVAHEPTGRHVLARFVDGGQPIAGRNGHDLLAPAVEESRRG